MGKFKLWNVFNYLVIFMFLSIMSNAQETKVPETPVSPEDAEIKKLVEEATATPADDLEEKVKQLQELVNQQKEELGQVKQNLDAMEQQFDNRVRHGVAKKNAEDAQREEEQKEKWLERNQDLVGRAWVGPYGSDGASGVKVDLSMANSNSTGQGKSGSQITYANITPFIRVEGPNLAWGAEMSLDAKTVTERSNAVKKFVLDEVLTDGELRKQVSKKDFENIEVYVRPVNTDKLEVVLRMGQLKGEFARVVKEVGDAAVYIHKTINDKYNLNTSMAIRTDIGIGKQTTNDPLKTIERTIWIQASAFNLGSDNQSYKDFAVKVLVSLAVLNESLKSVEAWGGFSRVSSGTALAGESALLNDPTKAQELAVLGFKIDLAALTGKALGAVYSEFVRRRKTGDITDQTFVFGWDTKLPQSVEGKRPMEVGVRFQSQQDDPDPTISDGSVLTGAFLYPLVDYNVALVVNVSYIPDSTDRERDGEWIVTSDFKIIW